MSLAPIPGNLPGLAGLGGPLPVGTPAAGKASGGFGEALGQALEAVDSAQKRADSITADFAAGKVEDVHSVVIALNEADLSLRLALEVRNKVVEAWQDISRMQA